MNVDIKKRTTVIDTIHIYQINLDIDGRMCCLKKERNHHGVDYYVLFDDVGHWIYIYDMDDIEMRNLLLTIGHNINDDIFSKESNNVDINSLPKPNLLF